MSTRQSQAGFKQLRIPRERRGLLCIDESTRDDLYQSLLHGPHSGSGSGFHRRVDLLGLPIVDRMKTISNTSSRVIPRLQRERRGT